MKAGTLTFFSSDPFFRSASYFSNSAQSVCYKNGPVTDITQALTLFRRSYDFVADFSSVSRHARSDKVNDRGDPSKARHHPNKYSHRREHSPLRARIWQNISSPFNELSCHY